MIGKYALPAEVGDVSELGICLALGNESHRPLAEFPWLGPLRRSVMATVSIRLAERRISTPACAQLRFVK